MKKILLVVFIAHCLLFIDSAHAQWVQTNGPYGGTVQSFAVSGTNLFAGTRGGVGVGGVFLSTNNGNRWAAVNTGLPQYTDVTALAVSGANLFAGDLWRRLESAAV